MERGLSYGDDIYYNNNLIEFSPIINALYYYYPRGSIIEKGGGDLYHIGDIQRDEMEHLFMEKISKYNNIYYI